jgi:6-phosphofructokinase 2
MAKIITPPPAIKKSTVGAGDSMVAGIVFFLSQGKSLLDAVQYGVACGTAATMKSGTGLCRRDDADRLYELVKKNAGEKPTACGK